MSAIRNKSSISNAVGSQSWFRKCPRSAVSAPASNSTSEAHPEIQSGRSLRQRIALIIRKPGSLMQREPVVLHDAQLHRRIESVTEAVSKGKKRIDVSPCWSELQSIGIA